MKKTEIEEKAEVAGEHDNVEIFTAESIITLYDEENKPIEFFEIASIEFQGKFYEIMQPVQVLKGMEEDEALIFEYAVDEKTDEKLFKPIYDEKVMNQVFELYMKAAADFDQGCGCSCDSCHAGCGSGSGEKK